MFIFIRNFLIVLAIVISGTVHAGTKVLGLELGVTTVVELKKEASNIGLKEYNERNRWTNGPQFASDGQSYNIEGLTSVLYIFEENEVLAVVSMAMQKSRFDFVFNTLKKKYKLVSEQRPFVGDRYALFSDGSNQIEVIAPHLSFDMSVVYKTNQFNQKAKQKSGAEKADKQKKESSKF